MKKNTRKLILDNGQGPGGGPSELHLPDDHPLPVTRRDFLKTGIIPCAAKLFVPSALSWLLTQEKAYGACPVSEDDPTRPLFFEVDGNGGMSYESIFLSGKPVPLGATGTPLDKHMANLLAPQEYGYQGRNFNAGSSYRTDLLGGFPIWSASKFAQNLQRYVSVPDMAKCSTVVMVKASFADNTVNNPYSCASGVASLTSKLLVGTSGSLSGTTKPLCASFSAPAVAVSGATSLSNLYRPGGLPSSLSKKIFDTSSAYNQGRRNIFANLANGLGLADAFVCGSENGSQSQSLALNPFDLGVDRIYRDAFLCNSPNDIQGSVLATLARALGSGLATAATYTLSGCDIHSGDIPTRISEETASEALAKIVGGMVTVASALNRKLMIYAYTDGSAYTHSMDAPWFSDMNVSVPFMVFFDPAGAPPVSQLQVERTGWLTGMSASNSAMTFRGEVAGQVALAHWWYFWKHDRTLAGLLPSLPASGVSLPAHLALI